MSLRAEWKDTRSNVKLGWFRSQLEATCVSTTLKSCDTMKQSVDDNIYTGWNDKIVAPEKTT